MLEPIGPNEEGPRLPGHPILGSIPELRRDPLGLFRAAASLGDFVRLPLGPYRGFYVQDPADVHHVLQQNHANYERLGKEHLGPLFGRSILYSEGETWRRSRRLTRPMMGRERLEATATAMTSATSEMLDRWRAHEEVAGGAPLDVEEEMRRLTLDIVGRALLGADFGTSADAVLGHFGVLAPSAMRRVLRILNPPLWVPTPANRRYMARVRALNEAVYELIDRRRASGEAGGDDLLSALIEAQDWQTGDDSAREQVRHEVMAFLSAGQGTTPRALSWAFYLLDEHPERLGRLREELGRVLGGAVPTFEDLPRLAYTRMVVDEVLRLYPPVWVLARRALGADAIRGRVVPKGSYLFIVPYIAHRDPAFWEEPEAFDPERFDPERAQGRPRYAYFPFGGGPRGCIASHFARVEMVLVLATVAQRFDLRLVPCHPVEPEPGLALRPRHGLPLIPKAVRIRVASQPRWR